MERRRFNGIRFFIAFVFTLAIFLIGNWFGQNMFKSKINEIEDMQNDFRTQTTSLEVENMFLNQNPCFLFNLTKLPYELYQIGNRLEFMEENYGKNNPDVLKLKEYYSLIEMRHWLFLNEIMRNCNYNITTILYFYSNTICSECEEQGYVLTSLRREYSNLNVYSFDVDISSSALDMLKQKYNITSTTKLPFIILGDKTFNGITPLETLKNEL